MSAFWSDRSPRERAVLAGGAALVVALAALQFLLAPLLSWRADQAARIDAARADYQIVAEAAARGPAPSEEGASDAQTPLRNVVSQSAGAAGLNLVYVNARPDGAVDANLSDADGDALFQWFASLRSAYGARIIAADISRETSDPSRLRAQVTFAREG